MCKVKLVPILLASLLISGNATAQPQDAKMLVYIQPQEYQHEIHLYQYFRDYWFSQGPYVEAAAKTSFVETFGDVAMCDAGSQKGNVLVWLQPRMYYHPQLLKYQGKLTAVAYTPKGEILETFNAESEKLGFIDVKTDQNITEVYQQVVQDVAQKIQQSSKVQTAMNDSQSAEGAAPCLMAGAFPQPKVRFMAY